MTPDPTQACISHLRHEEFRRANPGHVPHLDPCRYCFPDGEIDIDEEDLVTAINYRYAVHRDERTGPLTHEGHDSEGPSLAHKLEQLDPDDVGETSAGGGA